MAIFTISYIYALLLGLILISVFFSLGFFVKSKYKYAKVLGFILIIEKIVELMYLVFLERFSIFTNFSLILTFTLVTSILYLFTNNKLIYNLSYHFSYLIVLKLLFTVSKYKSTTYLYMATIGYFLILLATLYGAYFLRQKVYFTGYICSIISLIIILILSTMFNKATGENLMYTSNYIFSSLKILKYNLYLILIIILNILGISFMYILKKN